MLERLLYRLANWSDIFGSDVYMHYTSAYAWQANQFGHLFIGLSLQLLGSWIFGHSAWVLGTLTSSYALKEVLDLLISSQLTGKVFPMDLREVMLDGLVDWWFVVMGAVFGYTVVCEAFLWRGYTVLYAAFALVVSFLLISRPYLLQKRAFDRSGLPYFSRLSSVPVGRLPGTGDVLSQLVTRIRGSVQGDGEVQQWIITGPPDSGRTSLAVAMGGEASVLPKRDSLNSGVGYLNERQRVRYLSASRLLHKAELPCETASAQDQPWAVAEADLVIIDEISGFLSGASGADQVGPWLKRVLRVQGNEKENVFLRPICEHDSMIKRDMAEVRLLWVVDDPLMARALETELRGCWPQLSIERLELMSPLQP